jgi:hypothetical protein
MVKYIQGSSVYVKAEVFDKNATTIAAATLDGTVEFSVDDGATYTAGEWVGDPYLKYNEKERKTLAHRLARRTSVLAIDETTDDPLLVRVRVTDSPEVVVIKGLRADID